jgi:DNA-binding transcriptional ArsR family regulator
VKYNQRLSEVFLALSDPTRRAIVVALTEGEKTVAQVSQPFDLCPSAISKHLRMLERARLMKQVKRGRERWCRLMPKPLDEAVTWLTEHRRLWKSSLASFATYAGELEQRKKRRRRNHDR